MPNRSFVKNHHQEKILFKKRAFFLIAATAIILCMIFFKLFSLQVIQHKDFSTESRKNLIGLIPLTPNRGLIYDRNGTIIAKNIPSFTLALVPYKVKNISKTITSLKGSFQFRREKPNFSKEVCNNTETSILSQSKTI